MLTLVQQLHIINGYVGMIKCKNNIYAPQRKST